MDQNSQTQILNGFNTATTRWRTLHDERGQHTSSIFYIFCFPYSPNTIVLIAGTAKFGNLLQKTYTFSSHLNILFPLLYAVMKMFHIYLEAHNFDLNCIYVMGDLNFGLAPVH